MIKLALAAARCSVFAAMILFFQPDKLAAAEIVHITGFSSDNEGGTQVYVPPLNLKFAQTSYVSFHLTTAAPLFLQPVFLAGEIFEHDKFFGTTYSNGTIQIQIPFVSTMFSASGFLSNPQFAANYLEPETDQFYDYIKFFNFSPVYFSAYYQNTVPSSSAFWPFTLSIYANVPEPGVWMLQLLGFGLIGATLRVRPKLGPHLKPPAPGRRS